MRRASKVLAVCLALALAASACAAKKKVSFGVKIGALLSLTGSLSDFGPASARAVELAASVFKDAAKAEGNTISLDVVTEDDQTTASAGGAGARKLVDAGQ